MVEEKKEEMKTGSKAIPQNLLKGLKRPSTIEFVTKIQRRWLWNVCSRAF